VRKHAQATTVDIIVQVSNRHVRLIVQDDGQGFEVPEAITDFARRGSFGIMGLHERAQLFGGEVTIEARPGQGTTVNMIMPRQMQPSPLSLKTITPQEVSPNSTEKLRQKA
jgi:signal transduction histidine kinase